jgi:hypothetical protein
MMVCDRRCNLRLLSEGRIFLTDLISLDEFGEELKSTEPLANASGPRLCDAPERPINLAAMQLAPAVGEGSLPLYVADRDRKYGYKIRFEAISSSCCCWSLEEALCTGRFMVKRTLMPHGSLEVKCDGQPIYLPKLEAERALRLRPTSESALERIVGQFIDDAIADRTCPTNSEIIDQILKHPDVRQVSRRRIEDTVRRLKPDSWRKPGPRSRSSSF